MPGPSRGALAVLASAVLLAPGCAKEEDNEAFFNRTATPGYSEPGAEKIQYGSTGGQRRPGDAAESPPAAKAEPAREAPKTADEESTAPPPSPAP
jgi:hypothetical protein